MIYEKIEDICLTLQASDYLDLPARVDNTRYVEMPNTAYDLYRQLEKDFLLEFGNEDIVEVLQAAALSGKLLQFVNGAIYTDEQKNWTKVHDEKLTALGELIEEAAGKPLLVAYNYKTDAIRIREQFPEAVLLGKDPKTIERWSRSKPTTWRR